MDVILAVFLLGLFAPVTLTPVAMPVFFCLLAWVSGILFANVQKRV